MNYGNIKECDIADGPGVRVSLFVSGCRHHCKGCFNKETWDFVSARVVESGRSSPEAAELAELLAELGASELLAVEPPQPARMLQASAAQSSSERMRVYLNFIVVSSLSGAAAGPQHFKTIHLKYTFCRGGCQSDSAERISSGKYAPCTKKGCIFGNFAFLTFFAKIG